MNLSRIAGGYAIPYPHNSNTDGPDVATFVAMAVCLILVAFIVWVILQAGKKIEPPRWNDEDWRRWWDAPTLPDEPPSPGGLPLPKEQERDMVMAVSERNGT